MDLGLQGKVALVTGGSRGIGRCIALALAAEACKVGICARGREELERAAEELRQRGAEVFSCTADVTVRGQVEEFVRRSAQALGGVDVLVNNVGGSSGGTLLESTEEDWSTTFEINLFHAVRATRAAVPYMRERGGGAVVIISSISGWKPAPRAQYGCAKAAEIFLAGGLALELAPDRIRVNTVCPGSILFPGGGWERFRQAHGERFAQFEKGEFPAGRLGAPEEVADAVVFLASERARWINGAMIPVDGAQGRPSVF
jgi:3-oxoacyl-[acyl-carrier protein] reductase